MDVSPMSLHAYFPWQLCFGANSQFMQKSLLSVSGMEIFLQHFAD